MSRRLEADLLYRDTAAIRFRGTGRPRERNGDGI